MNNDPNNETTWLTLLNGVADMNDCNLTKVAQVLQAFDENDVTEDRMEYLPVDLQRSEGLTDEEAWLVYQNLQWARRGEHVFTDRDNAQFALDGIVEGLHNGLEGWSDEQKVIIVAFLNDITAYVRVAREMAQRASKKE